MSTGGRIIRLNKQGDSRQLCCTPFLILNQSVVPYRVLTVASGPAQKTVPLHLTMGFICALGMTLLIQGPVQAMVLAMRQEDREICSTGVGCHCLLPPPSASGSPCCLGKLTAAQRPPSASGLGQSTARPPPPFVRGLVTQIFPPSSQHQPHACGAFSRVARKAGPATSGTLLRPPPGEDSVEEGPYLHK